jgi:hypothetical protein
MSQAQASLSSRVVISSYILSIGFFNTNRLFYRNNRFDMLKHSNETPWPEGQGFFWASRLRRITPLRSGHHSSPGLKAWGFLEVL